MSEIAHMLGVTLATMTVACDKLEGKGFVRARAAAATGASCRSR